MDETFQRVLERAYQSYHSCYHRERDPVSLVHRYQDRKDKEVVAFFAALLSYGNVTTILKNVRTVLAHLGSSPYEALLRQQTLGLPSSFRHRFTTAVDLEIVAHWLARAVREYETLENFFCQGQTCHEITIRTLLVSFVERFTSQSLPPSLKKAAEKRQHQLKYLISNPERGSACKRLNMFLRWMVRPDDGIDLGLWKYLGPHQLLLPIDTHILQTLRKLRWTSSKTANWNVAEAATERLKRFSPEDPLRYDFSLCHLSMSGGSISRWLKEERHEQMA